MSRVTQKDIARRLSVSPSLVSRALGGKGRAIGASPATISLILETARTMQYERNAAALTLRGGAARAVGLVVSDFQDPFFGLVLDAVQRQTRARGRALVVAGWNAGLEEESGIRELLCHEIDGLLLVGARERLEGLRRVLAAGLPVVHIGFGPRCRGLRRFTIDEARGCRELIAHLRRRGARRFAIAGRNRHAHRLRGRAMLRALEQPAARHTPVLLESGSAQEAGRRAVHRLLEQNGVRPDAFLALDDEVAQGALRGLADAGLRVPGDLLLTGFDDIPSAAMTVPSLTTVRQPIKNLVAMALTCLETGIPAAESKPDLLPPHLIPRESTAIRKEQIPCHQPPSKAIH